IIDDSRSTDRLGLEFETHIVNMGWVDDVPPAEEEVVLVEQDGAGSPESGVLFMLAAMPGAGVTALCHSLVAGVRVLDLEVDRAAVRAVLWAHPGLTI